MRQTIFLVEDNTQFSDVISKVLETEYEILKFSDPRNVLELVDSGDHPDLVITDINMPTMEGLVFIEALRSRRFEKAVIAISGFATTKILARAFELGVVDFLEKPFTVDRLKAALGRARSFAELATARSALIQRFLELTGSYRSAISSLDARSFFVESVFFDSLKLRFENAKDTRKFLDLVSEGSTLLDEFERREKEFRAQLDRTEKAIMNVIAPYAINSDAVEKDALEPARQPDTASPSSDEE